MEIYRFLKQEYNEKQRTGKSKIQFPELKKININIKPENDIKIRSCNHESKPVIINSSEENLAIYCDFLYNNPKNLCFDCWNKQRSKYDNRKLY